MPKTLEIVSKRGEIDNFTRGKIDASEPPKWSFTPWYFFYLIRLCFRTWEKSKRTERIHTLWANIYFLVKDKETTNNVEITFVQLCIGINGSLCTICTNVNWNVLFSHDLCSGLPSLPKYDSVKTRLFALQLAPC